ncbi:SANT/Myb-like DNA-binding domain-containing protein [Virgibacillus salexigens]|uniref:Myb-like domain-containing protein n=1 Tax=Virgibacillus massiliensis TaxID=1462526 RepID=A0A024QBB4_9BACI|nr:SANT/Myb-like DNA-binding domain-containing protein [Virgibacillus massiliensis]CDQ39537.1 hypothetical protein BN990_01842 [Virgibacillus massiliensis]
MKWDDEKHNYLIDLVNEYDGRKKWQEIAKKMSNKFGDTYNREQVRGHYRIEPNKRNAEMPDYKETVEIKPDGSQASDKLVELSQAQMKDKDFLLTAHGYSPDEWEVVKATSSKWNHFNKEMDEPRELYASKIVVQPKANGFNWDKVIEKLQKVKPTKINTPQHIGEWLLEIPLFDQHFPISNYEYYKPTQEKIHNKITSRVWKEILLVIGSDLYHNDGFTGQTTKGTIIEKVDMEQAWEDACKFYEPIISKAIEHSERVKIVYSPGNHDESISWAFTKYLKARFPQCDFDDKLVEHKIHVFGDSVIGITHGDKGKKDIHNVFPAQFPSEWGSATTKEIHTGHFHVEDAKDKFGTMVRTLATRNKTDEWHKRNGYVGAHKRFMIFEFSNECLESIHYV